MLAPSGYNINQLGITPTICVTESIEKIENETKKRAFLHEQADEVSKISDRLSFWRRIDPENNNMIQTARSLCEPRKIINDINILSIARLSLLDDKIYGSLIKVSSLANKKFMAER